MSTKLTWSKKGVKTVNNWWEVILSLLGSYFRNNKFGANKRQTTNGHQPMFAKPT